MRRDNVSLSVACLGAGLGIAQNSFDGVTVKAGSITTSRLAGGEKNQFAWQAMAGVSYYLTPSLALDVGYRYVDAGESGPGNRLENHEVSAALRYAS